MSVNSMMGSRTGYKGDQIKDRLITSLVQRNLKEWIRQVNGQDDIHTEDTNQ